MKIHQHVLVLLTLSIALQLVKTFQPTPFESVYKRCSTTPAIHPLHHIYLPLRSFNRRTLRSFESSTAASSTFQDISSICTIRGGENVQHWLGATIGDLVTPVQFRCLQATAINGMAALVLTAMGQKSLTTAGLLHSMALGIGLWTFLGISGWTVGVTFLVLGSLVTKIKLGDKEKLGIAEKRSGARAPENVWGSAAVAMICAMGSHFFPSLSEVFRIAFVASFAAKLADTCSSEIGKAYGKTTYLITSLKKVPRGTEGAISLEGSVAGIGGGILMTLLACKLKVILSWQGVVAGVLASTCATTIESFIGAVFQDRIPWLSNELVNMIMTLIGAILGMMFYALMA